MDGRGGCSVQALASNVPHRGTLGSQMPQDFRHHGGEALHVFLTYLWLTKSWGQLRFGELEHSLQDGQARLERSRRTRLPRVLERGPEPEDPSPRRARRWVLHRTEYCSVRHLLQSVRSRLVLLRAHAHQHRYEDLQG